MNLYEINKNIEDLLDRMFEEVDEETGEVKRELVTELAELNQARDEKLDNIGCYLKNLQAEYLAIKAEITNLKDRLQSKENKIERLKAYVAQDLIAHGESKKESARVVFSFRTSKSINVTDEDKLPVYLKTEKVEWVPNKKAIKEAIEGGEEVAGAEIIVNQNLQIK